jgi:hypothetical protein
LVSSKEFGALEGDGWPRIDGWQIEWSDGSVGAWGGMLTVDPSFQKQPRIAGWSKEGGFSPPRRGLEDDRLEGKLALGEGGKGGEDWFACKGLRESCAVAPWHWRCPLE